MGNQNPDRAIAIFFPTARAVADISRHGRDRSGNQISRAAIADVKTTKNLRNALP